MVLRPSGFNSYPVGRGRVARRHGSIRPPSPQLADITQNNTCGFEEDPMLGDGGFAIWEYAGYSTVDANGQSQLASLLIHGKANHDMAVRVKLYATIGHLTFPIPEFTVNVAKGAAVVRQIDLRPFFNLHPKQLEYTLKIKGEVRVLENDAETKFGMSLDGRFLAYNEAGDFFELMDFETREELYPYGFTTKEGQQHVQRVLALNTSSEDQINGIGPNLYQEYDLTPEEIEDFLEARRNGIDN